jgi:hypothetical protein
LGIITSNTPPPPGSFLGTIVSGVVDIGAGIQVGVAATKTFLGKQALVAGLKAVTELLRVLVEEHD